MVVAIWVNLAVYGPVGFPYSLLFVAVKAVSLERLQNNVTIMLDWIA